MVVSVCVSYTSYKAFKNKLVVSHSALYHVNRTTTKHFYTCKNYLVIYTVYLSSFSFTWQWSIVAIILHFSFFGALTTVYLSPKRITCCSLPVFNVGGGDSTQCRKSWNMPDSSALSAIALTPEACFNVLMLDLYHLPDPIKHTGLQINWTASFKMQLDCDSWQKAVVTLPGLRSFKINCTELDIYKTAPWKWIIY